MDYFNELMNNLSKVPIEFGLVIIAVAGAIARYLNNFTNGAAFNFGLFLASVFASGFSGFIFGFVGISMNLPAPILFIMAGTGGYFADQAMKFALEYVQAKAK